MLKVNILSKLMLSKNIRSGFIAFIKSSIVKETCLFDERYFNYEEGTDLAHHCFLKLYKMVATSEAKICHHHYWSLKNKIKFYFAYYYMNRSKILYFIKFKFVTSLLTTIIKEIMLFPIKIKGALKTADIKSLKYYYLGFVAWVAWKK